MHYNKNQFINYILSYLTKFSKKTGKITTILNNMIGVVELCR